MFRPPLSSPRRVWMQVGSLLRHRVEMESRTSWLMIGFFQASLRQVDATTAQAIRPLRRATVELPLTAQPSSGGGNLQASAHGRPSQCGAVDARMGLLASTGKGLTDREVVETRLGFRLARSIGF